MPKLNSALLFLISIFILSALLNANYYGKSEFISFNKELILNNQNLTRNMNSTLNKSRFPASDLVQKVIPDAMSTDEVYEIKKFQTKVVFQCHQIIKSSINKKNRKISSIQNQIKSHFVSPKASVDSENALLHFKNCMAFQNQIPSFKLVNLSNGYEAQFFRTTSTGNQLDLKTDFIQLRRGENNLILTYLGENKKAENVTIKIIRQ